MTDNNPSFAIETITPDIARAILEKNTINRTPSPTHIAKLALHMKNGTFLLTGDAIRIGHDDTLYDGQHRLMACVQADMPFKTMVIRNVAHDALRVIDGGKSRSKQQQLKIADGIDPMATNIVLMLCRFAVGAKYDADLTTDIIHQIVQRHPAITETATAYKEATLFSLGANLPAAELILRAHGYQDEAQAWRNVWVYGTNSELGQAAFAFREAMIRDNAREHGKRWNHVFRRKLVTTTLIRAFGRVGAVTLWKASNVLFAGTAPNDLLTTTTFSPTVQTPITYVTQTKGVAAAARGRGNAKTNREPTLMLD